MTQPQRFALAMMLFLSVITLLGAMGGMPWYGLVITGVAFGHFFHRFVKDEK